MAAEVDLELLVQPVTTLLLAPSPLAVAGLVMEVAALLLGARRQAEASTSLAVAVKVLELVRMPQYCH